MAGPRHELGLGDLPDELRGPADDPARATGDDYEAARRRFDRIYFSNLLQRSGGSVTAAALQAGISRGHLHRRLKELDLDANLARGLPREPGDD